MCKSDFVLSGGELAALALLDAVARTLPGVLGDADSVGQDSFHPSQDGLLDCPHYTRPETWHGPKGPQQVPAVLLGGDHQAIARYRSEQRLAMTQRWRPDLLPAPGSGNNDDR
jgi:tRNA (guanine37-N1)-methyltransferase